MKARDIAVAIDDAPAPSSPGTPTIGSHATKKRSHRDAYLLPRSPFPLASTYAKKHSQALSNRLSKRAHTALYTIWCIFFTAGVPTLSYWLVVEPGLVGLPTVQLLGMLWGCMIVWYWLEMVVVLSKHFISADKVLPPPTGRLPAFSVIIVAYLPNEADIILDTLNHFRDNLVHDSGLEVVLAYNTPEPMEVEHDLRALMADWKSFRAVKCPGSTSKCDNINHVLPTLSHEFVALFDSDHLPEPDAFARAAHYLGKGYDIIQGRTVINSKYCEGLLGNLIRTEFELRHGIEHEVRNTVYNYAIFGGSNGYWRTRVLQDIGMDPEMLTEDVDSAIRSLSHGYKVWYDHHLVALEQPPPSFHALLKQRLRWSQGWFQVARRSIVPMYTSDRFSLWTKIGMWWILKMQLGVQIAYSIVLGFILVNVSATYGFTTTLKVSAINALPTWIMLFGFVNLPLSNKLLYAALTPFTAFAFQLIDLMAQVRLIVGYSQWNVTPRFSKQELAFSGAGADVGAVSSAPAPSGKEHLLSHNTIPGGTVPSPTFRYSPSFVRNAEGHMVGAGAV